MVAANIGLGSNLGDPPENLRVAVKRLEECGRVVAKSRLYHSKPWGMTEQPDFCNAVVQLETELAPRLLLKCLKDLEKSIGREASVRWGPRLIDLDILTYGSQLVGEPDLTIPHLHMNVRAFVLKPLCDIDPAYKQVLDTLSEDDKNEVTLSNLTW